LSEAKPKRARGKATRRRRTTIQDVAKQRSEITIHPSIDVIARASTGAPPPARTGAALWLRQRQ